MTWKTLASAAAGMSERKVLRHDNLVYLCFVRAVVDEERHAPAASRLAEERGLLWPLPAARVPEYTTLRRRVRKWSTIRVGGRICSAPSRLIDHGRRAKRSLNAVPKGGSEC